MQGVRTAGKERGINERNLFTELEMRREGGRLM